MVQVWLQKSKLNSIPFPDNNYSQTLNPVKTGFFSIVIVFLKKKNRRWSVISRVDSSILQKHLEDDLRGGKARSVDISLIEVLPFLIRLGKKVSFKTEILSGRIFTFH